MDIIHRPVFYLKHDVSETGLLNYKTATRDRHRKTQYEMENASNGKGIGQGVQTLEATEEEEDCYILQNIITQQLLFKR
jgi:hypothetical protein